MDVGIEMTGDADDGGRKKRGRMSLPRLGGRGRGRGGGAAAGLKPMSSSSERHADAASLTGDDDENEVIVLSSRLRRQDTCFARTLVVSVVALAVVLLVDVYTTPGGLDIPPEVAGSGGADSGTISQDQANPGSLDGGYGKAAGGGGAPTITKDQFDVEDWVKSGGKTPPKIDKNDPRYDYWFKHHDKGGANRPGIGANPWTPGSKGGGGNGGGGNNGNNNQYKPFNRQRWHNFNQKVTLQDGQMYEVVKQLKHDPTAFLEGLAFVDGKLYESTGLKGRSTIRRLDPETGDILESYPLPPDVFGEGLTVYDGKAVQLTYKKKVGYVYDIADLSKRPTTFQYETTNGEGWGMTYWKNQNQLIVSDGSDTLLFWDADTMKEVKKLKVTRANGEPADQINELEMWHNTLLCNVWYKDEIWVINPRNGKVVREYDFSALWPKGQRKQQNADVLNGIAAAQDPNLIYVTGKNWDRMFLVKLKF